MKLNTFLKINKNKLNTLEECFITNVFYKDYGEKGLDFIKPQIEVLKNDGSKIYIDFVVTTKSKTYAIETHGYHAHDAGGKYVDKDRFDKLAEKENLIDEKYDVEGKKIKDNVVSSKQFP